MDIDANLMQEASNDPPKTPAILGLCDYLLIEIFSHLDLYDRCIIVPQVCRRFASVLSLCLPKQIVTQELEELHWNRTKTSELFRNIGPTLRSVDISCEGDHHLNMTLKEIREHCKKIVSLRIEQGVDMSHITDLPKTIQKIQLDEYNGSSLDLTYLNNLDTLNLGVTNIPNALDWIKVDHRLKEFKLSLSLEEIPNNISTIDKLMSSISDNCSVKLDFSDEYQSFLLLDAIKQVSNVKEFSINGYTVNNEDINDILQYFADKHEIMQLHVKSLISNSTEPPRITLKTIDSLFRCSSLELIEFDNNCFTKSMIVGYMERLDFKDIRLQYGFIGCTRTHVKISVETFKELFEFVEVHRNKSLEYSLMYCPGERRLNYLLGMVGQRFWNLFSSEYLNDAPQLLWIRKKRLNIEIRACT